MKYVKRKLCLMGLLVLGAGLGGCAMNSDRNAWNFDGTAPVPLMATDGFLPVQTRDELGELLPYEATPNPYAEISGRIDKDAVNAYIDARRAFGAQKFDLAETALAEVLRHEPKLSGPWVMRGDIALANDDLADAVEHYAEAIKLNPLNFNAYLRLAKVQRMRGHFRHAQNTYARALGLWHDGPELHLNLGVLYDLYLNMPLQAQAHMEAYQLLSGGSNSEVANWLDEVRSRTGVAKVLKVQGADGEVESPMLSASPVIESPQPNEIAASAE